MIRLTFLLFLLFLSFNTYFNSEKETSNYNNPEHVMLKSNYFWNLAIIHSGTRRLNYSTDIFPADIELLK